jgi:mono/diheme cytochrome c family protein
MNRYSRFLALITWCCAAWTSAAAESPVEHGRYVFFAAGCISCHTADEALAGGRAIESPYGTFYPPNITPSREHGIGGWEKTDLERALRQGMSPQGEHYYPAFPYPSYTGMTREDIQALYAYLMNQQTSARQNRPHELYWPYSSRPLLSHWKDRGFRPGTFSPDPARSAQWNRGAYLARALGHCSECHTPRGFLGVPRSDLYLAGACSDPQGDTVPNITPDHETGIGNWSCNELMHFLHSGRKPDGSFAGGLMTEVLATSCMRLTEYDRESLAFYLKTVPPVHRKLGILCGPFDDATLYDWPE